MSIIKKLHPLKKSLFKRLTNLLQNSKNLGKLKEIPKNAALKVVIIRPNHRLGNQLLLSPLVQEIAKEFPNCKIDLAVNGTLSDQLFAHFKNVDKLHQFPKKPFKNLSKYVSTCWRLITKKYDIVIAANETSSSSKIFAKLTRGKFKIINSDQTDNAGKTQHIAQYPIYNFKKALDASANLTGYKYTRMSIELSQQEKVKGIEILNNFFPNDTKPIIGIYTFATGTKCYSKDWWNEIYSGLLAKFPEANILEILPYENVSQIDFKSAHYYSKDLREIAAVMDDMTMVISGDCGMMHLSAATKTTTIGLFQRPNFQVYGPYGGKNFSIDTEANSIIEIIQKIEL